MQLRSVSAILLENTEEPIGNVNYDINFVEESSIEAVPSKQ